MKTLADRKTQLQARLEELDSRIHEIEGELESHNNPDWEERAVEREADEVLERLGVNAQTEMAAIKRALARIDAGEYGDCANCGTEISQERLDVLPYTSLCKNCAGASRH